MRDSAFVTEGTNLSPAPTDASSSRLGRVACLFLTWRPHHTRIPALLLLFYSPLSTAHASGYFLCTSAPLAIIVPTEVNRSTRTCPLTIRFHCSQTGLKDFTVTLKGVELFRARFEHHYRLTEIH